LVAAGLEPSTYTGTDGIHRRDRGPPRRL